MDNAKKTFDDLFQLNQYLKQILCVLNIMRKCLSDLRLDF